MITDMSLTGINANRHTSTDVNALSLSVVIKTVRAKFAGFTTPNESDNMDQLRTQLISLRDTVKVGRLHNEVLLSDLMSQSAGEFSADEVRQLLIRAVDERYADLIRTDAGVVVTFSNLMGEVELVDVEKVLRSHIDRHGLHEMFPTRAV